MTPDRRDLVRIARSLAPLGLPLFALVLAITVGLLSACDPVGPSDDTTPKPTYHTAGEPCYMPGAESVDTHGRTLECRRDRKGNLTWLIK